MRTPGGCMHLRRCALSQVFPGSISRLLPNGFASLALPHALPAAASAWSCSLSGIEPFPSTPISGPVSPDCDPGCAASLLSLLQFPCQELPTKKHRPDCQAQTHQNDDPVLQQCPAGQLVGG